MERAPFLERRAAAYRAYYEHMPLPARMRAARARHAHPHPPRLGPARALPHPRHAPVPLAGRPARAKAGAAARTRLDIEHCERICRSGRTMLGRAQERWLEQNLGESSARVERARADHADGAVRQQARPRTARVDGWLGRYPAARQRLLETMAAKKDRQSGGARRRRPLLQRRTSSSSTSTTRRHPWWRASSSAPRSPRRPGRRSASTATCRTTRTCCWPTAASAATRAPKSRPQRMTVDLRAMESVATRDARLQHARVIRRGGRQARPAARRLSGLLAADIAERVVERLAAILLAYLAVRVHLRRDVRCRSQTRSPPLDTS